jgi:hypothetical protein
MTLRTSISTVRLDVMIEMQRWKEIDLKPYFWITLLKFFVQGPSLMSLISEKATKGKDILDEITDCGVAGSFARSPSDFRKVCGDPEVLFGLFGVGIVVFVADYSLLFGFRDD